MNALTPVALDGVGLGLRRVHLDAFAERDFIPVDFLEVVPENWMKVGGRSGRLFRNITERYPCVAHGLSLSLGSHDPLDTDFIRNLRTFIEEHGLLGYSEHLSYCSDQGHLYDLMPIPFTSAAVKHVASRIRVTQDILGKRMAIENVSYYAAPGQEMDEADFVCAVLEEADCHLLLDVNNVYVNSVNHGYDARAFIARMPMQRVVGLHVAGHYVEADDFLIDTHGAPMVDPVWALLDDVYSRMAVKPTLLERDFNIPPLDELLLEVEQIRKVQHHHAELKLS